MAVFRPITFRGTRYDFEHLEPMELEVKETSSGKSPKKILRVLVNFGCHCFTEEYDVKKHTWEDRYVHEDERRAFSPIRYERSKNLREFVKGLGNKTAYVTRQNNYVTVQRSREAGATTRYAIFFTVEKGPQDGADVIVTIASAYDKPNLTRTAPCINFSTLVAKTHKRERVQPATPSYIRKKTHRDATKANKVCGAYSRPSDLRTRYNVPRPREAGEEFFV
jgi:hypothetical protein